MASALAKTTSYSSTVNVKLTHSGTMTYETGASQFYAKRAIVTIPDYVGPEDENRRSSINLKKLTPLQDGETRFPKLAECAHFHYEFVGFGELKLTLDEDVELDAQSEQWIVVNVSCDAKRWTVRRTYESLYMLDKQLHRCIYDRKFSMLPELTKDLIEEAGSLRAIGKISAYLSRFSVLADNMINCGPILCWMEMDNHGKHLMVPDTDAAVNIPAVGAAHAVRRYVAQSTDEISFEVGDILSIIDNPTSQESAWWRGKKEFEVGYFPSEYVELIGTNQIPPSVVTAASAATKPVLHKRGKMSSFLVGFFSSRPSRTTLKQTGIMKERVFGCDLGEHLLNSGENVPLVLKCCAEVLEKHGIVDGIYRLCGVASNLQKLRNEFDENRVPDLTTDMYLQDIHCISSLVKMYFRELPNPLLTYQLYDKFTSAISETTYERKVDRLREVVRQLPPPHFRTAEFLFKHLSRMASSHPTTSMHHKNLAIVWAPNLLRSKLLDQAPCIAALSSAGLQAVVTEFLIAAVDEVFDETCQLNFRGSFSGSCSQLTRPKSVGLPSSGAKLLSLEEAQERALGSAAVKEQKYISVGEGPAALTSMYHTVIDLPKDRKKNMRRSAITWRSLFSRTHSMTLPSSLSTQGKFSDIAINDSTNPKEGDSLKRVKRTDTIRDSDSTGDLVDGKRRSISLDVIDSTSFDRLAQNNSVSQTNSSKADAISADVDGACFDTIRSFQSASVGEHLMPSVEKPFQTFPGRPHRIDPESSMRSPLPSFRKGSRVTSRPLSESSPTEPEKPLVYSDRWQMPSAGASMGSCGSDRLFFDQDHFETPGCSKRTQLDSGYHNSRISSAADNSRQSVSSFKPPPSMCSGTMEKVEPRLPSSGSQLYRQQPLEQNNLCENVEKSSSPSSPDCIRRLLSDEQEFLAWKLSGSSGSRDLLSELSPAMSRVMPKSNYAPLSSSACDDSVFCSERTESPDMYESCQSLNVMIPAACDIGSIPENIGGLVGEDENDEARFSSLNINCLHSNTHSRQDVLRPGKNQKHRKSLREHGSRATRPSDPPLDSAASLSVDSGRADETCFALSAPSAPKRSAVSSEPEEINWKSSQISSLTEDLCSSLPLGLEPSLRASKSPQVLSDGRSVSSVDQKSSSSRRDRVSDRVETPAQSPSSCRPPVPIRRSIKEASKPRSNTQDSPGPVLRPDCLSFQKQHGLKEQSKSPSDDVFFFDSVDVSRKSLNSEHGSEQQTDSLPEGFLISRHRQSKTSGNTPVVADKEFGSSLSFSSSSASSRSDLRSSSVSRSPATERAPGGSGDQATPLNSTSSTDRGQRRAQRSADASAPISASEFFSESENPSSVGQGSVDSPSSSDCAVYAEILRTSSSRRSHPPVEARGKPSAGAYVTRAGAPVSSASAKPENCPSGNNVGSFKERRKVFEKPVLNSSSSS